MDGTVEDIQHPDTTLFFPISWDMCMFGSPAKLEPESAEFCESDLLRLRRFVIDQAKVFVASPTRLDDLQ